MELTQSVDLVEHRDAESEGDEVVAPDPLVLDMEFQWELCDLGREGVWEFHGASGGCCWCFRHLSLISPYDLLKLQDRISRVRWRFGGFSDVKS